MTERISGLNISKDIASSSRKPSNSDEAGEETGPVGALTELARVCKGTTSSSSRKPSNSDEAGEERGVQNSCTV